MIEYILLYIIFLRDYSNCAQCIVCSILVYIIQNTLSSSSSQFVHTLLHRSQLLLPPAASVQSEASNLLKVRFKFQTERCEMGRRLRLAIKNDKQLPRQELRQRPGLVWAALGWPGQELPELRITCEYNTYIYVHIYFWCQHMASSLFKVSPVQPHPAPPPSPHELINFGNLKLEFVLFVA